MGRSIRRSPSLKMNSKICLILFGLLVALAVLSAAENSEENSLSEEVASSRLIREAEAGKRKRNNKAKRSKKNKKKGGRAAATTCAAFIKLVTKLAGIVSSFPSSSQAGVVGGYITSSTVTCTTAEKTSLKTAEA